MSTPRWMPRSAVALAAAALGTAGLALAMVPSFAQESKPPTTEQPVPPGPGSDLKEGGDAAQKSGPGVNGAQENGNRIENVAADLTLESARIESVNLNDTDQEYAVYHFGRTVHEISDVQGFTLKGFNVDTKASAADAAWSMVTRRRSWWASLRAPTSPVTRSPRSTPGRSRTRPEKRTCPARFPSREAPWPAPTT